MHRCRGNAARLNRFIPRLHALEDRVVPSCTVTWDGTTLTVTGDSEQNHVRILDADDNVTILCDGETLITMVDPLVVNVATLQQQDTVEYILQDDFDDASDQRTYNIDLGQHQDVFTADLGGHDLGAGSSLRFNVNGNGHHDIMTVATGIEDDDSGADIAAGASLVFDLDGNNGKDRITVAYNGNNEGTLSVLIDQSGTGTNDSDVDADRPADHANGKDTVIVNLTLQDDPDSDDDSMGGIVQVAYSGDDSADGTANPGSNGKDAIRVVIDDQSEETDSISGKYYGHNGPDYIYVEITDAGNNDMGNTLVDGGNGPDNLTLLIHSTSMALNGHIDGGNGPDRCVHTAQVTTEECEDETPASTNAPPEDPAAWEGAADLFFASLVALPDDDDDPLALPF